MRNGNPEFGYRAVNQFTHIKPENIIVNETTEAITIKLADFDCAVAFREGSRTCHSICGTVPFAAPEVLDGPYDGCAADIWSVGVVLAEVLCGARVLEFAVEGAADAAFADNIRTYFRAPAAVADLLEGRCHPQLRPLLPLCGAVIGGMLEVDPARRLEAGDVRPVVGQGMAPLAAGRVAPGRPAPSARPLAPGGQPTPGLPRAASAAGPPR
ncbi:unnamed protein product [Prorocentrum cordatum]|uniref:Protein kinase domain-containing protein n=1 Tax=Prorocentrum cordatum TaxID=2364126 RepID=A0ABN9TAE5_9DINO|nr:unnamed protein product [Polarella glacialis]